VNVWPTNSLHRIIGGSPGRTGLVAGLMLSALFAARAPTASGATDPRGVIYRTAPPMDQTVHQRILPQLDGLLDQLAVQKQDMTLDGVKVFESGDKFLPGKIAIGMAYALLETPRTDPRFNDRLANFREISDLTVGQPNDTWGIYYYVEALRKLQQAGLLDQAVSPATLAKLKIQLDWRRFVRPDLTLIDLPNNYYGVAFSIARLRMLLGWEDAGGGQALLAKMMDHYRRYSGVYGFADETNGEGRFDRYSVLLIGEIAQRFIETDLPPTPELKARLRKAVDLMLPRFNLRGEGFEYGRSLGPYGETCFLEVMTAAAKFGVLTPREKTMAYAFSSRIAARYADFWYDPKMASVNLWEHGRRPDDYRGEHRILGENLSLARQYIYTDALWNEFGFKNKIPSPGYAAWLDGLPKRTVTWFAKGRYDRLLITLRDGDRVIGLPVINGGAGEHTTNPYFPAPFSPGLLSGVADGTAPNLVPRLTLADGSALMPLAYFRGARVAAKGDVTTVTWRQTELDRIAGAAPAPDTRISVKTTYLLSPGRITRTDEYRPTSDAVDLKSMAMEFDTFAGAPRVTGEATRFAKGDVTGFTVKGLDGCHVEAFASPRDAETPTGPLSTRIVCSRGPHRLKGPMTISWTLTYR
jgi:hypothetical protein